MRVFGAETGRIGCLPPGLIARSFLIDGSFSDQQLSHLRRPTNKQVSVFFKIFRGYAFVDKSQHFGRMPLNPSEPSDSLRCDFDNLLVTLDSKGRKQRVAPISFELRKACSSIVRKPIVGSSCGT